MNNTYNFGSSDTKAWTFDDYVADYDSQIAAVFDQYDTYEQMAIAILKIARSVFWVSQSLIDNSASIELYDFRGILALKVDTQWLCMLTTIGEAMLQHPTSMLLLMRSSSHAPLVYPVN